MPVKACLNGARTREEHPAVPLTPAELAADAAAAWSVGAFAVHVRPRDGRGVQTLDAAACDASVDAIRPAVPGLRVGLSTAETIDHDPFARAAAIKLWGMPPDFVSVNLSRLLRSRRSDRQELTAAVLRRLLLIAVGPTTLALLLRLPADLEQEAERRPGQPMT